MKLTGYCDPWSAESGQTVEFKVSSTLGDYTSEIVQLIHGDQNPLGPGLKTKAVADLGQIRAVGEQALNSGSYIQIDDVAALDEVKDLSVMLWVMPTLQNNGDQCLISHWHHNQQLGWALSLSSDNEIVFRYATAEGVDQLSCGHPLQLNAWYFVAARVDSAKQTVSLITQPLIEWLPDTSCTAASARFDGELRTSTGPLLIGAWCAAISPNIATAAHFNGKIENPSLFGAALSDTEIAKAMEQGVSKDLAQLIASWDFSRQMDSDVVEDIGPQKLNGHAYQTPARGMTGHLWDGNHINFADAPAQYAAIKFHEDDLTDANWQTDFRYKIPDDLASGFYAARLSVDGIEDYIPFFVCPKMPSKQTRTSVRPKIAVIAPTMSYLAYANDRLLEGPPAVFTNQDLSINKEAYDYCFKHELKSTYDRHPDGSGMMYSSSRRPLVNMRPGFHHAALGCPHQLPADLHLVDWLHAKTFTHDVITDIHLHRNGVDALADYQVLLTGTHPEYWTREMLDALQDYLDAGGRLMYMGGNGFYWVTSYLPKADHVMEIRRAFGTRAWESEPGEMYHAASGERGGLWRWRGRSPQRMTGIGFTAQGFDNGSPYTRKADSYKREAAFVFAGVEGEVIGDSPSLVMNKGAAGFELDRYDPAQGTPPHTLWLASSTGHSNSYQAAVEDILMSNSMQGGPVNPNVRADMTLLTYPSGGAVFSTGSIAWCGSLSHNAYDNDVSIVTENVLRRFLENEPVS